MKNQHMGSQASLRGFRLHSQLLTASILSLALGGLVACGAKTDFSGDAKNNDGNSGDLIEKDPSDSETPDAGDGNTPFASLNWFWECNSTPGGAPIAPDKKSVVVQGVGPHVFAPGALDGTPITFSGKLCPPAQLPRDILFIIDVSGSMDSASASAGNNDPRIGNTCGRLAAMQQVMASLVDSDARFALVTFSDDVETNSGAYFNSEAALAASVASSGTFADVACDAVSGTNYQSALIAAKSLLPLGRAGATKEIYFISDGQPDSGASGINIATSMKAEGVAFGTKIVPLTIATIMLGGTDEVLENSIASRASNGKALHVYVSKTKDLASTLASMTANSIVSGDLSYRPIGEPAFTHLNLLDHLQGFDFTLPSFSIDLNKAPEGLEVKYEYHDKLNNRYESGGKLLWKDGAAN